METQDGGWNVELPFLLRHLASLGRQICQLYEPADLYRQGNSLVLISVMGYAVAQLVEYFATSRKVAGSVPDGGSDLILPVALWPWGRLSL
jgi:hypothetical protein